MVRDTIPFENFGGIVNRAIPPKNSFKNLINLRNDRVIGGLANRSGLRTIEDLAFQPDAFIENRFVDSNHLIVLGNGAIYAKPSVLDGTTLDIITDTQKAAISTYVHPTLTLDTALVRLKDTIVYNETRGDYAVVIAQPTGTTINLNRDESSTWVATDILLFYRNDLLVEESSALNILVPDSDISVGGWTVTPLFSKINDKLASTEILSSVLQATVPVVRIDPSSDEQNVGWTIVGGATAFGVLDDGVTPDDTDFVKATQGIKFLGLGFTNPGGSYDNSNPVIITVRYRSDIVLSTPAAVTLSVLEGATYSAALLSGPVTGGNLAISYTDNVWRNAVFNIPAGSIVDPDNLFLQFGAPIGGPAGEFHIGWIKIDVPQASVAAVPDPFEVALDNLGTGIAEDQSGKSILSFSAKKTFNSTTTLVKVQIKELATVIAEQEFFLTTTDRTYQFQIDNIDVTDFDDIRINIEARLVSGESDVALVQWIEFTVDTILTSSGGLEVDVLSYPKFHQIDNRGNLYLDGVKERRNEVGLWIGKIPDRKFFGGDFSFDGLYVTALMDDLTRGAFAEDEQHIQVRIPTVNTAGTEAILPDGTTLNEGDWTVSGAPTLHEAIDADDAAFIFLSTFGSIHSARFSFANPTGKINPDNTGYVRVKGEAASEGWIWIRIFESGVEKFNESRAMRLDGTETLDIPFPTSVILDFNNIEVDIRGVVISGNNPRINFMQVRLPLLSVSLITITEDTSFAINLCAVEDGFNKTKLLYENEYGDLKGNPTTFEVANQITLLNASGINAIDVRIGTKSGERINRRYTALELYGGKVTTEGIVWRFLKTISLSDNIWTFSNNEYFTETTIGAEILTGAIYEIRNQVNEFSKNVQVTTGFIRPENRSFAIPEEDKRTIVYSPISGASFNMSSVLASGNFFQLVSTPGDLVALDSVNRKLLAFKKYSHFSIPIDGIATPRPDLLDSTIGLISAAGVALVGERLLMFPAHNGIYRTDGFKTVLTNLDWVEDYRNDYSSNALSTSIGFYDSFSDTYHWFVRTGTDTADLWSLDVKFNNWRKDEFIYSFDATRKFGMITYASKSVENRVLFADDFDRTTASFMQLYEFPRADGLFTNRFNTPKGFLEISTRCELETNQLERPGDVREMIFIDSGYVRASSAIGVADVTDGEEVNPVGVFDPATDVKFKILQGSIVKKSIPIDMGVSDFAAVIDSPLSRFGINISFRASGFINIRQFGVNTKRILRSGSVRQTLEVSST